jgi:beta-1,2-mannobiose phosphorylase / 1,2-beta-oligomannan phosphorylase
MYYGAADTRVGLATCKINDLLDEIKPKVSTPIAPTTDENKKLVRFEGNPILTPIIEWDWQSRAVFNPAAIYEDGKVHLIYRALSQDGVSVLGYAVSRDGLHIDENLDYPIYQPREDFEKRRSTEVGGGCEDPRITEFQDRFWMTYTAWDGENPPRVALTSISVEDFLRRQWNWTKPEIISLPNVDDKDACILKNRNGKYIVFHRLGSEIWIDVKDSMDFGENKYLGGKEVARPRSDKWDNVKLGISAPPIETDYGFVLLYHGVSEPGFKYKVGAMLLDDTDPTQVLARTDEPIFEPVMPYEIEGEVPNVVFPCGALVINETLYVYYGAADKVIGVATMKFQDLLDQLIKK